VRSTVITFQEKGINKESFNKKEEDNLNEIFKVNMN
jgi:hypothetical protein